ncbi:MAG: outer membrane beta-barrel protein, partial [Hyphomonadaceae bacterium]
MFLVGIAAVAAAGSAQAQTLRPVAPPVYDRGNNQGVRERPQPEYEPLGIPVGAFRFYPRIGAAVEWNDNIYATEAFEVEDMATILSAAGRLTSNWSQHALAFEAEVENTAYGDNDAEDGLTWGVGVEGRVDVRRDTQLYGSLSYFSTFEPRGFVDTLDLAEPIEYDELRGQARLTHLFNRLRATGIVDYSSVDYDDGMDVFDVPVDQDFRDRDALELTGRLDYALSPDTAVFVAAS